MIKFPGTNADLDVVWVLRNVVSLDASVVWFKEFKGKSYDAIVLPGGFSYGDWLRAGAIAARSKVIDEVIDASSNGVPILGICNGFQILTEAGLLPGALITNDSGKFLCEWVKVRIKRPRGPWLKLAYDDMTVDMPIAHGEGRYYIDSEVEHSPVIKYYGYNPNGSLFDIAGIASNDGLIMGLMPHPERAAEPELVPTGYTAGGLVVWRSLATSLKEGW